MKKNTYNHGFTIIEVLLAAILLAAGLVTVFSIANKSIYSHYELFNSEMAVSLASQAMSDVRLKINDMPDKKTTLNGNFNIPFDRFSWKAIIEKTEKTGLYKVTVTIARPGAVTAKEFNLTTFMYR